MTEIAKGVLFSTLTVILSVVTSMLVKILAQDDIAIIHILISRFSFSLLLFLIFLVHVSAVYTDNRLDFLPASIQH